MKENLLIMKNNGVKSILLNPLKCKIKNTIHEKRENPHSMKWNINFFTTCYSAYANIHKHYSDL